MPQDGHSLLPGTAQPYCSWATSSCPATSVVLQCKSHPKLAPTIRHLTCRIARPGKGVMKSDGKPRFTTLDGKPIFHFMVGAGVADVCRKGPLPVGLHHSASVLTAASEHRRCHYPALTLTCLAHGHTLRTIQGTSTFSEFTVVHEQSVALIDKSAPLDKVRVGDRGGAFVFGAGNRWVHVSCEHAIQSGTDKRVCPACVARNSHGAPAEKAALLPQRQTPPYNPLPGVPAWLRRLHWLGCCLQHRQSPARHVRGCVWARCCGPGCHRSRRQSGRVTHHWWGPRGRGVIG